MIAYVNLISIITRFSSDWSEPNKANVNVNVNLYSITLSHSASNALGAPNTAETDAS